MDRVQRIGTTGGLRRSFLDAACFAAIPIAMVPRLISTSRRVGAGIVPLGGVVNAFSDA